MNGSRFDVNGSNVTLSLMLKKHVEVMSYLMKLLMIIVVLLIEGNPQGSLCGSSSIGYYFHIVLNVTCKSH